jgi:hypothetical protein
MKGSLFETRFLTNSVKGNWQWQHFFSDPVLEAICQQENLNVPSRG